MIVLNSCAISSINLSLYSFYLLKKAFLTTNHIGIHLYFLVFYNIISPHLPNSVGNFFYMLLRKIYGYFFPNSFSIGPSVNNHIFLYFQSHTKFPQPLGFVCSHSILFYLHGDLFLHRPVFSFCGFRIQTKIALHMHLSYILFLQKIFLACSPIYSFVIKFSAPQENAILRI